jgi:hypothetical protein
VKDGAIAYSYPVNWQKSIAFSWQDTNVYSRSRRPICSSSFTRLPTC